MKSGRALSAVRDDSSRNDDAPYAVHIRDHLMAPVFEPGTLLWVDPTRRARSGDDVVCILKNGTAVIRRMVLASRRVVICRRWGPVRDEAIARQRIRAIHVIVGWLRP